MHEQDRLFHLEGRCTAEGLSMKDTTEYITEEDGTVHSMNPGWRISSTAGAFTGSVRVWTPPEVEFFLSTSFEHFRPIEGYEAMWSPIQGVIEAAIVLQPLMLSGDHAFTGILQRLGHSSPEGQA